MIVLCWNCRGLGNPWTVRHLRRLVKLKKPVIVFLMETLVVQRKVDVLRVKLGFQNAFCVDCVGRSGGLILFWNSDINLVIQNYSQRHVNAVIHDSHMGISWKFTGFYGHPDPTKRQESWTLLRYLAGLIPAPWMVCGDFNEIISLSEKSSGSRRSTLQNPILIPFSLKFNNKEIFSKRFERNITFLPPHT